MILSDQSILREIKNGNLVIDPPVNDDDISTSSLDVHLGDTVRIFKSHHEAIRQFIDLSNPEVGAALTELTIAKDIPDDGYPLYHNEFVLSQTREVITLPSYLAARLEGRSTNARFGIAIHSTAPTVHPKWSGNLTLEIYNHGSIPCLLRKGVKIGQLIFEYTDSPSIKDLNTRWQGQTTPVE